MKNLLILRKVGPSFKLKIMHKLSSMVLLHLPYYIFHLEAIQFVTSKDSQVVEIRNGVWGKIIGMGLPSSQIGISKSMEWAFSRENLLLVLKNSLLRTNIKWKMQVTLLSLSLRSGSKKWIHSLKKSKIGPSNTCSKIIPTV